MILFLSGFAIHPRTCRVHFKHRSGVTDLKKTYSTPSSGVIYKEYGVWIWDEKTNDRVMDVGCGGEVDLRDGMK